VIGCLAAGFEVVGRNLYLAILPVLLDLFLWLVPHLSIAPLLRQFTALLLAQPAPDQAAASQIAQAVQLLEQFGEQFNLFSLLSLLPLFNVPSLLARHAPGMVSPLGESHVLAVTSVLSLTAWAIVLLPAGLVLGALYLSGLAHRVRTAHSTSALLHSHTPTLPHSPGVGKIVWVLLFAAGLLMIGVVLVPLWLLLIGIAAAIVPLLGFLAWMLGVGIASYVALHLLFVVHGILLGERGLLQATWESIVLIHTQFPAVVGLVVLVLVIYAGLGFVWSLPSGESWLLSVGILGNACIATGLIAATFVFYQERIGQLLKKRQASAQA
jgi:hypothetical protein